MTMLFNNVVWFPVVPVAVDPVPADPLAEARARADRGDVAGAERLLTAATRRASTVELEHLHAVLLVELGQTDKAVVCLRRALYLDPRFIIGHLVLGTTLRRLGDREGARRAYRNAIRLCGSWDPNVAVPLADGASPAWLAGIARGEDARLD